MKKVPLSIRSHLVAFLFEELEGKKAEYEGTKVSSVVFTPSSSVAKYLANEFNPENKKNTNLFLFIKLEGFKMSGQVFINNNGHKERLHVSEEMFYNFNALIEDMFRISLSFYIKGLIDQGASVTDAIWKFIEKYDLLECGFDFETIKRLYYRQNKKPSLSRLQYQTTKTTINSVTRAIA